MSHKEHVTFSDHMNKITMDCHNHVFVGSDYKLIYRKQREPTKRMVLIVGGRIL